MNQKITSKKMAGLASEKLRSKSSSKIQKELAAGVLSQRVPGRITGKEMEATASEVLRSSKYSAETKALAASLVSQSDKKR